MLEAFVRFLIDSGVVGAEPRADDGREIHETQLINFCIVIAGRLGLDHGYVFDDLGYGPYSYRVCRRIEEAAPRVRAGLEGEAPPLPPRFDRDRFLRLLAGRDDDWIETAAELIIHGHARPDTESLAEWLGDLSIGRSPEYTRSVIRDLTSPEIGIALDCDKFMYKKTWRPLVASAIHYPDAARPMPAAAG